MLSVAPNRSVSSGIGSTTTKLIICSEMEEFEARTFTAFESSIQNITEDDTIDSDTSDETVTSALLKSKTFNFTYIMGMSSKPLPDTATKLNTGLLKMIYIRLLSCIQ